MIKTVRAACADVLHVLPGMQYGDLKEMDWKELSAWRETAVALIKTLRGEADG